MNDQNSDKRQGLYPVGIGVLVFLPETLPSSTQFQEVIICAPGKFRDRFASPPHSLCGPPLPERRPPRSWLRAIPPRLRVAAAIFRIDGPFGPHATDSSGRPGQIASGRNIQSREPAVSQLLLHCSRGWIAGPTLHKQAPHWLAMEVPPPGCIEPTPLRNRMCGTRCLHPAGVSARCLAPFSYELHVRGAKRTIAVISSDYPVQTRP